MNPSIAVFLRRGRQLGSVLVLAFLAIQALAPVASADPLSSKRAEAARLADQIATADRQLNVLAERVNAARIKAAQLEAGVADAEAQMREADAKASQVKDVLKEQAVATYMRGGQPAAVASGGDPARADAYVKVLSGAATDAIDQMRALKINMNEKRANLMKARAAADAQLNAVKADEQSASAADAQMRATLSKVKGDLASLVAAEQAAQAHKNQAVASRSRSLSPQSFGPIPGVSAGASAAVNYAKAQLGKPYQWGGSGPNSFDCSGLTMMAWNAGGVSLPHNTNAQYAATTHVPLSAVQPGDLIFYGSDLHHEAIYVGGGQVIHAPHTGAYVEYASMYMESVAGASRPG